ncbi:hypothetical protein J7354_01480 [Sulfitobacter sp. R18_2]|uniref:hypothetical protein n=1 Tax=Sulfitobacter sp. R18_2 TaxID=2821105 RepID=UPI001ADD2ED3|nr:hypothetical protein [Sulfitobacter sp. R18_2]MBO9437322.1 hypothetical protein [Sulfitobacter sp. R18_2]
MTFAIRHHTEQLHRKATKFAPVFTMRNEPSREGLEDWLAAKMREDARRPHSNGTKPNTLQQRVAKLMADGRERTASDVATAVGLSGRSGIECARGALSALHKQGILALGFICKGQLRISVWRLSQGRPSTAREAIMDALSDGDRLSLAKIVKRSGFLSKNPMASLDTTLRRMLAEGIVTRGKYFGHYEYQLAHVSCKDRIAAAKAEASA